MGKLLFGFALILLGWALMILTAALSAGAVLVPVYFFCEIAGAIFAAIGALEKRQ